MHGIPSDLDLSCLVGAKLARIDLGPHILHFLFEEGTTISVEGEWLLRDLEGVVIDRQMEPTKRQSYSVHVLFHRAVTSVEVRAPQLFRLHFEGGLALEIRDDSRQFESFSIRPQNIFV